MTIKLFDVYCGDSVRIDNGSQADMPIFGRFAAIVRTDSVRVTRDDESGDWYIGLPNGCSRWIGDATEEETVEVANSMRANLDWEWSGWTRNDATARSAAIASAKVRHNLKAMESAAYRKKFGEVVD